jgi:hypothetical protein
MTQESSSFLKKRTKKLLVHEARRLRQRGARAKSFLLLFFKKEGLAYFLRRLVQRIANAILGAADGILNLAGGLFSSTLGFCLLVAGHVADAFLDRPLDLVADTFNAILVHKSLLLNDTGSKTMAQAAGSLPPSAST